QNMDLAAGIPLRDGDHSGKVSFHQDPARRLRFFVVGQNMLREVFFLVCRQRRKVAYFAPGHLNAIVIDSGQLHVTTASATRKMLEPDARGRSWRFQTGMMWPAGSRRRRSSGSLVMIASPRDLARITTDASMISEVFEAPQSSPQERASSSSSGII